MKYLKGLRCYNSLDNNPRDTFITIAINNLVRRYATDFRRLEWLKLPNTKPN